MGERTRLVRDLHGTGLMATFTVPTIHFKLFHKHRSGGRGEKAALPRVQIDQHTFKKQRGLICPRVSERSQTVTTAKSYQTLPFKPDFISHLIPSKNSGVCVGCYFVAFCAVSLGVKLKVRV